VKKLLLLIVLTAAIAPSVETHQVCVGACISGSGLNLNLTPTFAKKNVPYSGTLQASGGSSPYTFTLVGGTLPGGMTLASCSNVTGCSITGTDSTVEAPTFSIQIQDTAGTKKTFQFSIAVAGLTGSGPCSSAVCVTPPAPTVAAGNTQQMICTSYWSDGRTLNCTSVSGVNWISSQTSVATINASSGLLMAVAPTNTNVTAAFNGVTSPNDVVTVTNNLVAVVTTQLPNGQLYQVYPEAGDSRPNNMTASGGTPPYKNWTVSSGTAPPGLTLTTSSAGNGVWTGTPTTAGTYNFQVTVQDSLNNTSASQAETIIIASLNSPLTVTPPTQSINAGATLQFTATGPYSDGSTGNVTSIPGSQSAVSWASANNGARCTANSATTISCTLPNNVVAGDIVTFSLFDVSGAGSSISLTSVKDANNNSYAVTPHSPTTYTSGLGMMWQGYNLTPPAGATTLTAIVGTAANLRLTVDESKPSGGSPAFDLDVAASNAGPGTAMNSPAITTTGSGELEIAGLVPVAAITSMDPPWTAAPEFVSGQGTGQEYILSSSGTSTPVAGTATTNAGWSAMISAFSIIANSTGTVWTSSNPGVATISSGGLATARGQGTTTIQACILSICGSTTLTVTASGITLPVVIVPTLSNIALGQSQDFKCYDSSVPPNDLTSTATWSSDNSLVAAYSGTPGHFTTGGTYNGQQQVTGTAHITCSHQ